MRVPQPFILASASSGRRQVLESYGIPFEVLPSTFDETRCFEKDPLQRARILAREKASTVAVLRPDAWVVGCDTVVVAHTGELLEKPVDVADAERMLRLQSGTMSKVHSALCLIQPSAWGKAHVHGLDSATVKFHTLDDAVIAWWLRSGLWHGCSGGFRVRESDGRLLTEIHGDETTVIGFPMGLFTSLLRGVINVVQ